MPDFSDYVFRIVYHFLVCETDDGDARFFQFGSTIDIPFFILRVIVDATIQLHNKVGFGTIEICNEVFDRMLTTEVEAVNLMVA